MPPHIALFVFSAIVIWLLITVCRGSPVNTVASWVVLVWVAVGASRPVSTWFSTGSGGEAADSYDQGNSFERNFYLILIAAGVTILWRRRVNIGYYISHNLPFFIFVGFWGLSTIWADHSFITFKRWFKDLGTVVMALTILSDPLPVLAFRSIFVRCACILIPYSLLLIRYFGDLGRVYSSWDGELMYVGVTTHKNTLGVLALIAIVFLIWDLTEDRASGERSRSRIYAKTLVLAAAIYILHLSHSATSLVCATIGGTMILFLQAPFFRKNIRRLRVCAFIAVPLLFFGNALVDLKGQFLALLGRDPTLTTRTEVWPVLIQQQTSIVLGPGFKDFWAGDRLKMLWEKYGIIQAHNGYLETFLSGGVVGTLLLVYFMASAFMRTNQALVSGTKYGIFRFSIWLMVVIHNWTEATFNSFSPLWIALLVVSTDYAISRPSIDEPPLFSS